MHITIVAAGDHSTGFALAHEIETVKAAVPYGDRVTLASPRTNMVAMVRGVSGLTEQERIDMLKSLVGDLPGAQNPLAFYETLKRKRHKTRDELLALKRLEREFSKAGDELSARAAKIASDAGLDSLLPAIEKGVLELDALGIEEGDTNIMVERMTQLIADLVAPTSTTLPMFDDGSGGFLRAMMEEGTIPNAQLAPSTQAGVAARFIAWIPTFPNADLDTILNARNSLQAPLVRYRSALIGITRDLEETPIDARFESVVLDLHRQHVAPALLEIEELSHQLGLRPTVSSAARAGAGRWAAEAAIGFAAAQLAGLEWLIVSTAGIAGEIAAKVLDERRQVTTEQRENQFYFEPGPVVTFQWQDLTS
jgi:hypothetical protein